MGKAAVSLLLGIAFACWAALDLPKAIGGFPLNDCLGSMAGTCGFIGMLPVFLSHRLEYFNARRRLEALPYLPLENADALPADEILVRGSEEPAIVQSEVLLRAAKQGQETSKEELLRVSQE
jgi:hypothetical protein